MAAGPRRRIIAISSGGAHDAPRVSIVTTVYDRVECLDRCLRAMRHSAFQDFEQIVVSDSPPQPVREQVRQLVERSGAPVLVPEPRAARERLGHDAGVGGRAGGHGRVRLLPE